MAEFDGYALNNYICIYSRTVSILSIYVYIIYVRICIIHIYRGCSQPGKSEYSKKSPVHQPGSPKNCDVDILSVTPDRPCKPKRKLGSLESSLENLIIQRFRNFDGQSAVKYSQIHQETCFTPFFKFKGSQGQKQSLCFKMSIIGFSARHMNTQLAA